MAVLGIRGLKRYYGKIAAVDGIDLETSEGELLAILGPSGSGKSTLMRMVSGLEQPSAGEILLDGRSIVGIPPRKRNVAMVFQSYALYPHMSVYDNIVFPLKSYRVPKNQWSAKVDWATRILGISHLLARRPARLSGGESQRVALARALVRDPELFVFDEPLSALDAQVRHSARAEIRDLQARTGITTLYVTHDQVEALGLGDRVAVIKDGRIRQLGTPETLYFDPADRFVASFIGNPPMNLIEHNGSTLGIRAKHFTARDETYDRQGDAIFPVTIEQLEFLGTEWLAYGVYEDGHKQSQVIVRLSQEQGPRFERGKTYHFTVEHRHIKTFDKASDERDAVPAGVA
jgi:multiple sugar transport system ATP-binding protein